MCHTTVCYCFSGFHELCFYILGTTREPREGEVDGVNYTFMSVDKFEDMVKNGEFLEHGCYDGNCQCL